MQLPAEIPKKGSVLQFLKGFHSEATMELYSKKLAQFVRSSGVSPDELLRMAKKPRSRKAQNLIIDYVEGRKGEVSGSTIRQTVSSLRHFFEMNDASDAINWSKVSRMVPKSRKIGSDRAPTVEEIRQMLETADARMRCIILVCSSSGIRVGAFEGMKWGDIRPIYGKRGDPSSLRAARLVVYRGSVEEYVTFITPECWEALLQYRDMRLAIGERVTDRSPVIRDAWDSNRYRKNRPKDPADAVSLTPKTIANMMGLFLKEVQLRNRSGDSYEFKQVHGFRKYFKTNAERAVKTIDVEKMMGHAENYYKPSEEHLLEQYIKAVPELTISEEEEIRTAMERQAVISDKKIGEIERENVSLQDRLGKLESSYGSLKEILEDVLLARTK